MAKLEVSMKEKKGFLRDVTLCYTKIQVAAPKYQDKLHKEYTVDAIVTEDVADEWEEAFAKNRPKKIKTSEFKDRYKIDPPSPKEKNQFMLKVKVGATFKKDYNEFSEGDLVPATFKGRPKVLLPVEGGVKDVTMTTLVGNGSVGDISFSITDNDYGVFPQLSAVLVKDLVVYENSGAGSDFGTIVNAGEVQEEVEESTTKSAKDEVKASNKPQQKSADDFDDFDDTIPF